MRNIINNIGFKRRLTFSILGPTLIISLLAAGSVWAQVEQDIELLNGLSDHQRFSTYPYVDKAYQLLEKEQLDAAIDEVGKARRLVPDHIPLARFHINLLLKNKQYLAAIDVADSFSGDYNFPQLEEEARQKYVEEKNTSVEQVITFLESIPDKEKAGIVQRYVVAHDRELTPEALQYLYSSIPISTVDSLTAETLNEALLKVKAYSVVFGYQQKLCELRTCTGAEWRALALAAIMDNRFKQSLEVISKLETSAQPLLIDQLMERMVGRSQLVSLLTLLQPLYQQGMLNKAQIQRLYSVAREIGQDNFAAELVVKLDMDCTEKARQAYEINRVDLVGYLLIDCTATEETGGSQLDLLVAANQFDILADKKFSDVESEKRRVSALVDHYNETKNWQALVGLLNQYDLEKLSTAQRRSLVNAHAQQGDLQAAANLALRTWRKFRLPDDLDLASYYLVELKKYKKAFNLLAEAGNHSPEIFIKYSSLNDRVLNLLMDHTLSLAFEDLESLASVERMGSQVLRSLLTDNQCGHALKLIKYGSGSVQDAVYLQCEKKLDSRLAYLMKNIDERNAVQKSEAAFLLLNQNEYTRADSLIESIDGWETTPVLIEGRLAVAEQQNDVQQQKKMLALLEKQKNREGYVAIKRAYLAYNDEDYQLAADNFNQAFASDKNTRTPQNLEQAAFSYAFINSDSASSDMLMRSIDQRLEQGEEADSQAVVTAQSLYREVDSPWQASISGWAGDSTNFSQTTGQDFQADYFLSTEFIYDFNYDDKIGADISFSVGTLSGGEDFFFDNNEIDTHLKWKPWKEQSAYARVGFRANLEGEGSRSYFRLSYDPLESAEQPKLWSEDTRLFSHILFLDGIYYIDTATTSGYGRYKSSYDFKGKDKLYYQYSLYPFLQYQFTNDTEDKETLDDTRIGVGLQMRSTWSKSHYKGYSLFSEVAFEWQYVLNSDISQEHGNALLLRFSVFY